MHFIEFCDLHRCRDTRIILTGTAGLLGCGNKATARDRSPPVRYVRILLAVVSFIYI